MAQSKPTQKELSLISDLLTYEHWAKQKSKMHCSVLTEPELKTLATSIANSHTKCFNDLFNHLNSL